MDIFFPLVSASFGVVIFCQDAPITCVSFPDVQVAPWVSPLRSSLWMPLEGGI